MFLYLSDKNEDYQYYHKNDINETEILLIMSDF